MIDPKEFDAPTIGGVVDKAKDTVSDTVENIASEADFAKKRFDIDMDPNKPKPTDFDENPPQKNIKEPLKEKIKREFEKGPTYTDTSASKNYDTRSDADKYFDQQANRDSQYKPIPDSESLALRFPPPPGGDGGSKSSGGESFADKLKNKIESYRRKEPEPEVIKMPTNPFDELLKLNISDSQADKYAKDCEYYKSIKVLRAEFAYLQNESAKLNREEEMFSSTKTANDTKIAELEAQYNTDLLEMKRIREHPANNEADREIDNNNLLVLAKNMSKIKLEIERLQSDTRSTGNDYRMGQKKRTFEAKWESLKDEISKYMMAVTCGKSKDKVDWKKHATLFSQGAEDMLGTVRINPVTDVVGYGGMTGKSAVAGIQGITGGYKVSDTANSWTRTNVGDRQLVESLVAVRPNRVIAPFGVPGTVGESNLQNQFQYSSPLKRIGVGDVTARGGYQLRLEDIHRRKKKSQPKIVRKKVIEKKKVMGNNKALRDAMSMVNNQRIIDIKVPAVAVKNIKGSGGEPSMKGIVVLNNMKDATLGKSTLNIGMKGINSVMITAIESATKRAKGKKVK